MNEQPITPPVATQPKQMIDRLPPFLKNYWLKFSQSKFYMNKKIFYPVAIFLGLIVLIILLGLIFGGKKTTSPPKRIPSPTPSFVRNIDTGTAGTDQLSQIEQKLTDIKNQINALDVKQSRLQPPALNFNIKF